MPQYMLLILNPTTGGPTPEQQATLYERYSQYTQDLHDAGLFVSGDPLQGPDVATTVRVRAGETQLTDGPFAETKEYLAGYYVIECDDLDTALQRAAQMPNIEYGSVEVRPIWDMTSGAQAASDEVQASA
ncbi:MAG: YciI family protein [Solirubrobacteraceae bacterium]|jgi:hypothetical protein